jgi:hypothetical protein
VDVLEKSIDLLDDWLIDQGTDEELCFCLIDDYTRGRGGITMCDICHNKSLRLRSQDEIGWRQQQQMKLHEMRRYLV